MSNPAWLSPRMAEETGHVTARVETTPSIATPSISVSTQQTPKKFAPMVAPKPKFNPYKQNGQGGQQGDFPPPPPPPPPPEEFNQWPASPGAFPPPPTFPPDTSSPAAPQMPRKTVEERRSSLDAEIDSLTSILADLESSSPYQPRPRQSYSNVASVMHGSPQGPVPGSHIPVIGHQRMVMPSQPLLTATKKTAKPQGQSSPGTVRAQPVPASYTTASTPARPAFNVQVKTAQPNPHFMAPGPSPSSQLQPEPAVISQHHASPRAAEHGYRASEPTYTYSPTPSRYPEPTQSVWQPEPTHSVWQPEPTQSVWQPEPTQSVWQPEPTQSVWQPEPTQSVWQPEPSHYQPPADTRKTDIIDPAPSAPPPKVYQAPPSVPGPSAGPVPPAGHAEDELERLTRKMLYDMENPPADDYFGRCAGCGENVVGEGQGCTAMEQVFHVDCFSCVNCSRHLRGQPFYAVDKRAFCEPCYINTLERCTVCFQPIMERILRATGSPYHPQCFTCVVCHRSLDGIPFTVDNANQIHCIEDFHKKFAPRCWVCKEPIMPAQGQEETVRIVALDHDFHVQCYRCVDCGKLLSEGDAHGCYPLDGQVYCKPCNAARIQVLSAHTTTEL